MSLLPEERLLIDRYLEGHLSGIELQEFMECLETEAVFRERVSMQNLLVEGIIICADKDLQDALIESISYRKPMVPLGLKLILTFLFITISGIILWNYLGHDSSGEKKPLLSFSWLSGSGGKKSPAVNQDDANDKEKKSKNNSDQGMSSGIANEENVDALENQTQNETKMDSSIYFENQSSHEFVVKKDQLLISQNIIVEEGSAQPISKRKLKKDSSLSEKVAIKLNPAAGLEVNGSSDEGDSKLLVEFWISPINYKGYKYHTDKFILFGMQEPDQVRLFTFDGNLYMNYLNDYFILEPSEEYTSYQVVKNKEFSLQISK